MKCSYVSVAVLSSLVVLGAGRTSASQTLNEKGMTTVNGHAVPYVIQRLPVSSFPLLPSEVANELNDRGCMIPQTYEAHQPENVVHASLAHADSSDWAVLCSAKGRVSLLVFLEGMYEHPKVLASALETARLQVRDSSGVLGFNWGIDRATPRQMHDAEAGLERRPPAIDHDALADSKIERHTVYHVYTHGVWTLLDFSN
ncbi:MAG: hypothetical protein KGN79_06525 [Acidobacteriota bacterium]|nr:hypothetical protein [Acidobacteriota bacterium]